ncbi:hypothetical protein TspCOW1_01210 [Thiohalobacter sp. COW1]|uniref:hypothetical protein n=1 Tax=Thiohalobacter sp. COW1 TaxID=2795687 RepID=UPI0019168A44|nr:hypothetical protein [Thiohalobacter sp. COW1]BCO30018.1 hypothetical protein TspCOW1_01210 [Thiohalobacter sp. COW1]
MVEMVAQQMLNGQATDDTQDQVFFTGVWSDAYPAILVRDPILPDSAKIQLLYLMQAGRTNPYGANPLPSVGKTARDLGKSPTTVVRDRAIIRMARWATQCRRVRDAQGRMRGLVWSLHSEPASLAETTSLDSEYMGLLEQAAAGHFDRIARRVAKLVLAAIDHDIGEGRDPLAAITPMEQRLEAMETIRTGHGRCFAGYFGDKQDSNCESGIANTDKRISNPETCESGGQGPISNFEISGTGLISNLETYDWPIDPAHAPEFETGKHRSSSSIEITTTTNREKQKSPHHFSFVHSVDDSGGSSNTPHMDSSPVHSVDTSLPPLDWPQTVDDNRKRLVQRMLQHHLPDRPGDHQEVINALAAKLADKDAPIRNLGNYVTKLCKLARAGELCPVEPPCPPERPRPPDKKLNISNLRGEIGSLLRLIEATRHTGRGNVQALEAQLARRREELRELEQAKH